MLAHAPSACFTGQLLCSHLIAPLQADFSTDLAIGRGNEPVWRALQEIATYELAVWDERTDAKDSRVRPGNACHDRRRAWACQEQAT